MAAQVRTLEPWDMGELCKLLGCVLHAAKTKPAIAICQCQFGRCQSDSPILPSDVNEKAHVHPSVPRYIGIDINHSTPLAAQPHSVSDPAILFLLTLQWRLPVQLHAWNTGVPAQHSTITAAAAVIRADVDVSLDQHGVFSPSLVFFLSCLAGTP